MNDLNPLALCVVAEAALIGSLFGAAALGAAIALGVVLLISVLSLVVGRR